MIFQTLSVQSPHTHALLELSCLFEFSMIRKIICAIWNLKLSFLSLFSFWDALWLCYQLIIHACSDTDLRQIDLCKIFLSFFCVLVWSIRTVYIDVWTDWWSGRHSLEVQTGMEPTCPDSRSHHRPNGLFISSGRARDQSALFRGSERPDVINPPSGRGPHRGNKFLCSSHSHYTPLNLTFGCLWALFLCVFGFLHFSHIPGIVFQPLSLQFSFYCYNVIYCGIW
jgi:hypothetical protein